MSTSPFVLSSLISIISLIGSIRAQFIYNYEVDLQPGATKYIYSPNFSSNYASGNIYRWTIRSQDLLQLDCGILELPSNDVLIAKRTLDDPGVRSNGRKRFFFNSRNTIIYLVLYSNNKSQGGRFLCVVISKCNCGWKNPARIADGEETGVNEFPMMAGLVDADSMAMPYKGVFCGATIINYKQVVTAAHCFENKKSDRIGVLVGDHNLPEANETDATRLFKINTLEIHPSFSENGYDYDIAIITIDGNINFSPKVGPVCLPFQYSQELFVNQPVILLGWGAVEYGGQRSTVLQKARVNVIANAQCQTQHQQTYINDNQICTLDPFKDSCQYDSGGPVIWRDYTSRRLFLIGLISWGSICGNNQSTINTRITAYVNWIENLKPEGTLFLAADVFAVASLAMPDWIITDVGGDTRLGLMWSCMTLYNRHQVCYTPDLQPEWLIALSCIFVGCILITVTIILLGCSHWDRHVIPYARWVGFTAMVLFCLAAVIFPMGFHIDEIGGQPYQLPNSHQVGISYILFVLALWITVISELFAGKVCLPHF